MNRALLLVAVAFGTSSVLLVDSAVKGGVILLLAAHVVLTLSRDSAATRHLVWLVAILAILVVPVFSAMLPQWQVLPAWAVLSYESPAVESPAVESPDEDALADVITTTEPTHVRVPAAVIPIESDLPSATGLRPDNEVIVAQPAFVAPEVTTAEPTTDVAPDLTSPSWSWINALSLLWAIGFCVLMLRLIAARFMLWSSERRGTVIGLSSHSNGVSTAEGSDDSIVETFERAYRQLGVGQRVSLLLHTEKTIPVVWGVFRHWLLLPVAARQWSDAQLRSVLLHELAHIKRRARSLSCWYSSRALCTGSIRSSGSPPGECTWNASGRATILSSAVGCKLLPMPNIFSMSRLA
jgi:hypothetical protein